MDVGPISLIALCHSLCEWLRNITTQVGSILFALFAEVSFFPEEHTTVKNLINKFCFALFIISKNSNVQHSYSFCRNSGPLRWLKEAFHWKETVVYGHSPAKLQVSIRLISNKYSGPNKFITSDAKFNFHALTSVRTRAAEE